MGRLFGNGINQADLVDLLVLLRTNIIGIQTKLDADGGVADTDYLAGATTALAAIPTGIQTTNTKSIHNQGLIVTMLNDLVTKWNATLTKLDSDGTVNGTNYNSLWAVTDVVGDSKIDAIFNAGIYQGAVIRLLNNLILSIAGVNAKLDLDSGVSGTDYASLWNVTDTVIEQGTYSRMRLLTLALAFGSALMFSIPLRAETRTGKIIDKPCAPLDFTSIIDADAYGRISMQAVYANGAPASHTIRDGAKSSNTLTVTGTGNANKNASISINGVTLTQGVHWSTAANVTLIAQSISSAIINSASLTGVVTSTHVAGVIFTTASVVGVNAYAVTSSTAGLAWTTNFYGGGFASDVSITGDSITKSTYTYAHGFATGLKVLYASSTVTTGIGGLGGGTTYYIIRSNDYTYQLATSSTNAAAGTAIDITSIPGNQTFSITPLSFSATAPSGFRWQAANDRLNWVDLSVSSVTYTGTSGSTLWDFGSFNYRYLRVNALGPTNGCVDYDFTISGKIDKQ